MCTYHNYYNYHWYTSRINQIAHKLAGKGNAHILVVNNNNMAKDWDTLEVLFGGNCTTSLPGSTIFRSKLNSVADGGRLAPAGQLSPRALHKLCVALCPEIQIYKKIILLAENMDNPQRRMSLEEVQR